LVVVVVVERGLHSHLVVVVVVVKLLRSPVNH
jgi:hypothetical protein